MSILKSALKSTGSRVLMTATLGLCLLLAGCGSKVSKENADKIKVGMTQAEVEAVLGTGTVAQAASVSVPGVTTGSIKTETWTDGEKQIVVTYTNDKVSIIQTKGL